MIYFFYGNNTQALRDKIHSFIEALRAKKPDAVIVRIDTDSWSQERLELLADSQGLFEKKSIIVMDSLFEDKEIGVILKQHLPFLAESKNIFIIIESQLSADTASRIKKVSEKTQLFDLSQEKKDEKPKTFDLAEAVAKGDRRKAWVLYQKFIKNSVTPEEIHGVLFWQIKSLALSLSSKTPQEAGLHPFVFSKSKSMAVKQGEEKVADMLSRLVKMYHEARRGGEELKDALERFILKG